MSTPLKNSRLWTRLLPMVLLAALFIGWTDPASGASRCITAVNGGARGDVLINRCNQCRIAKITHKRSTGGFPLSRTYRIAGNGKMELSFKGSGQTRVVSDNACEAAKATTEPNVRGNCAKLTKRRDGTPALINTCPVCRGVVIERVTGTGKRLRQVYTVGGRAAIPIPLRGAAQLAIASELPCKR